MSPWPALLTRWSKCRGARCRAARRAAAAKAAKPATLPLSSCNATALRPSASISATTACAASAALVGEDDIAAAAGDAECRVAAEAAAGAGDEADGGHAGLLWSMRGWGRHGAAAVSGASRELRETTAFLPDPPNALPACRFPGRLAHDHPARRRAPPRRPSHRCRPGAWTSPVPGLMTVRAFAPSGLVHAISKPIVCLVVQGAKNVCHGCHVRWTSAPANRC
jgi:hypothetical protein